MTGTILAATLWTRSGNPRQRGPPLSPSHFPEHLEKGNQEQLNYQMAAGMNPMPLRESYLWVMLEGTLGQLDSLTGRDARC